MRTFGAGWQEFLCEECGQNWRETTRDWQSPSKEICQNCFCECDPMNGSADDSILVDSHKNLLKYQTVIILAGEPPIN